MRHPPPKKGKTLFTPIYPLFVHLEPKFFLYLPSILPVLSFCNTVYVKLCIMHLCVPIYMPLCIFVCSLEYIIVSNLPPILGGCPLIRIFFLPDCPLFPPKILRNHYISTFKKKTDKMLHFAVCETVCPVSWWETELFC